MRPCVCAWGLCTPGPSALGQETDVPTSPVETWPRGPQGMHLPFPPRALGGGSSVDAQRVGDWEDRGCW